MQVNLPAGKEGPSGREGPLGHGRGWQQVPGVLTCVVVLGAVAQVLLIPEDELWECQALCHLHGLLLLQPLEDEVVHGVANWRGCREPWDGEMYPVQPHPEKLLFPAHVPQKK